LSLKKKMKLALMEKMINYLDLYKKGSEALVGAGIADASLDARLLLEYICGTDHNTLLVHGDMPVEDDKAERYMELISKRAAREPLAYILGEQEFMGLDFTVSEDVLIPNQDTEVLVEEALRYVSEGMRILDLCTGSGCIALSILNYSNGTTAVATDISEKALEIAGKNAERLGLQDRYTAHHADLYELKGALGDAELGKFDIIVSNPPYIPTKVIDTLEPEVRVHEPFIALDGKEDGLFFYRKIVENVDKYLLSNGWLLMEIGYDQGESVKALMENKGFKEVEIVKDLGGNDRVVLGCYY